MFTAIRSLIRRMRTGTQPTGHALDLTDGDIAALRLLRTSPEYEVFVRALDARIRLVAEHLLAPAATSESVHFYRGTVSGLRAAGLLVDEIITSEEHLASERSRLAARADVERAVAASVTYGSPFYSASAK